MITVKEAWEELGNLMEDGFADAVLVMSSDEEGNSHSFLQQIDKPVVAFHDEWNVEFKWNDEGTEQVTVLPSQIPDLESGEIVAVCLWP
jgi:hypothetical protein